VRVVQNANRTLYLLAEGALVPRAGLLPRGEARESAPLWNPLECLSNEHRRDGS
jgi:hypothetical protein